MPTKQGNVLGENLAETLDIGNFTADGQQIEALNGDSFLNLRFNDNDNWILLSNDSSGIGLNTAYLLLNTTSSVLGHSGLVYKVAITDKESSLFGGGAGYSAMNLNQITVGDIINYGSFNGGIVVVKNDLDRVHVANDVMSTSLNSESTTKALVERTVLLGGEGMTAKTDNAAYANQISFQESGVLFDTLLQYPLAASQDNLLKLPNKSGTLALLSDTSLGAYVEKWTLYAATLDLAWHSIVIGDASPNSVVEFTIINNIGDNDIGIRQVGSALDRRVMSVKNSATTLTVKTDALSQIEFFTSDFSDTDFYFSAQL